MATIETRTKETRDDWGFTGVATYHRESDFNHGGCAHISMSDTASGHGWAGMMHKDDLDKLIAA